MVAPISIGRASRIASKVVRARKRGAWQEGRTLRGGWQPGAHHASRRVIHDHVQAFAGRGVTERGLVSIRHPADQALALALRHHDRQARCLGRRLAAAENHLGDAAPQVPTKVEPRPATKLFELHPAQLRHRLVFGHLAGDEAPEDVSHNPRRTLRMRCQCVPAQ